MTRQFWRIVTDVSDIHWSEGETMVSVEERVVSLLNEVLALYITDPEQHALAVNSIIAELVHCRLLRRYVEEEFIPPPLPDSR